MLQQTRGGHAASSINQVFLSCSPSQRLTHSSLATLLLSAAHRRQIVRRVVMYKQPFNAASWKHSLKCYLPDRNDATFFIQSFKAGQPVICLQPLGLHCCYSWLLLTILLHHKWSAPAVLLCLTYRLMLKADTEKKRHLGLKFTLCKAFAWNTTLLFRFDLSFTHSNVLSFGPRVKSSNSATVLLAV